MLDPSTPFVTAGRIAIVLLNTLSFPLQCHPCRVSIDNIIRAGRRKYIVWKSKRNTAKSIGTVQTFSENPSFDRKFDKNNDIESDTPSMMKSSVNDAQPLLKTFSLEMSDNSNQMTPCASDAELGSRKYPLGDSEPSGTVVPVDTMYSLTEESVGHDHDHLAYLSNNRSGPEFQKGPEVASPDSAKVAVAMPAPSTAAHTINNKMFSIMTVCIILFSYFVSIFVGSLDQVGTMSFLLMFWLQLDDAKHFTPLLQVLAFVGATGSTTISFILPGLFYYKLFPIRSANTKFLKFKSICALLLVIYGFSVMITCVSVKFYQLSQ